MPYDYTISNSRPPEIENHLRQVRIYGGMRFVPHPAVEETGAVCVYFLLPLIEAR